jgi:hypothetical protein
MPGATAGGLPYPLGSEPVRDGDNAIKALADALQVRGGAARTEARYLPSVGVAGGTCSVAFATPFAGSAVVSAFAGWPLTIASLVSTDSFGFTCRVKNQVDNSDFSGNIAVWYIAIGIN